MPALFDVMALLYKHEINCGLESDWDDGFTCWIGNSYGGHSDETRSIRDPLEIAEWFDAAVQRAFKKHGDEKALDTYMRDSNALFGR